MENSTLKEALNLASFQAGTFTFILIVGFDRTFCAHLGIIIFHKDQPKNQMPKRGGNPMGGQFAHLHSNLPQIPKRRQR